MSLLHRPSHSARTEPRADLLRHINQELEAAVGRYEPIPLEASRVPVDPYLAWLEERHGWLEQEDRSRIRWVYHSPSTGAAKLNPKV
jgi:hypothetical protein